MKLKLENAMKISKLINYLLLNQYLDIIFPHIWWKRGNKYALNLPAIAISLSKHEYIGMFGSLLTLRTYCNLKVKNASQFHKRSKHYQTSVLSCQLMFFSLQCATKEIKKFRQITTWWVRLILKCQIIDKCDKRPMLCRD